VTEALFVCPNLQSGGAERHRATMLPRLASRGIDARLITLDGQGPFFDVIEKAGVPATCLRARGGRIPTYA
jgi:hypothetical protein